MRAGSVAYTAGRRARGACKALGAIHRMCRAVGEGAWRGTGARNECAEVASIPGVNSWERLGCGQRCLRQGVAGAKKTGAGRGRFAPREASPRTRGQSPARSQALDACDHEPRGVRFHRYRMRTSSLRRRSRDPSGGCQQNRRHEPAACLLSWEVWLHAGRSWRS